MGAELMVTNEGLILLHQNFADYRDAVSTLAGLARGQGLVDDSYLPALLTREEQFPTGLEFPVPIAIPHIETGVKRSFVSIATLDEPVKFLSVDGSGTVLDVRIIFVFGILNPKSQIEILRRFARSFPDKDKIAGLLQADTRKELLRTLNNLLDNLLKIEADNSKKVHI